MRELGRGRAGHAVAVLEGAQGGQHTFDATVAAESIGPKPTVLIAGDDTAAEAALVVLITAGGVHVIDTGRFARAHELEAVGFPPAHSRRREGQLNRWLRRHHVNNGARSRPPAVLLLLGRCDRVAGEQLGADRVGDVG